MRKLQQPTAATTSRQRSHQVSPVSSVPMWVIRIGSVAAGSPRGAISGAGGAENFASSIAICHIPRIPDARRLTPDASIGGDSILINQIGITAYLLFYHMA